MFTVTPLCGLSTTGSFCMCPLFLLMILYRIAPIVAIPTPRTFPADSRFPKKREVATMMATRLKVLVME